MEKQRMTIRFTKTEALDAIVARIRGDFDNEELKRIGRLSSDVRSDVNYIVANIVAYTYPPDDESLY